MAGCEKIKRSHDATGHGAKTTQYRPPDYIVLIRPVLELLSSGQHVRHVPQSMSIDAIDRESEQ